MVVKGLKRGKAVLTGLMRKDGLTDGAGPHAQGCGELCSLRVTGQVLA